MTVWSHFLLFCVLPCCITAKVHYYFNPIYMYFKWEHTDSYCTIFGRHAASIHSLNQNKAVHHECIIEAKYYMEHHEKIPNCWIGLYIDTNQSFKWTDNTEYNPTISNELWCSGYPKIDPNITDQISGVYIDAYRSCWSNTYDLHLQMQLICGPQMLMDMTLWIELFYLPLALLSIMLAYNIYVCMQLTKNLYIRELNWIIEPSRSVKCTAISVTILLIITCISYIISLSIQIIGYNQTGIVPPVDLSQKEFPHIFHIAIYFEGIGIIGFIITALVAYIHITARLKNEFDHNKHMESVIPSCCGSKKWFYIVICILISTIPIILMWAVIAHFSQRKIALGVYVVVVVLINAILLFMYLRGLRIYALRHYFREDIHRKNLNCNVSYIDDITDTVLAETRRHTVVFGIAMIYNVLLLFIVVIILIFYTSDDGRMVGMLAPIVLMIREFLFIQSLYLSFRFSHTTYEKCCCICDKWMKGCCEKITQNRHKKYLIAYYAQIEEN